MCGQPQLQIEIFKDSRFGAIRVAGTSDEPLFCLADICRAVDLTNPSSVKSRLEPEDTQLIDLHALNPSVTMIGNTNATFVTETGFYEVLLFSNSPKVKPFRRWITKEILPTIRKAGQYAIMNKVPHTFAEALRLAAEQQEKKNKKISNSLKGHSVSIETRMKISESLRRKTPTKDESLKGLRNGRLIILEEIERKVKPSGQKERMVKCLCDCGKVVEVRLNNFIHGRVKSCGCLQREIASNVARKHGLSLTKINNVYRAIKRRCYNKNCDDYKHYGGRGIKMCKEWKDDFTSFYNWAISNGYDLNKTMKEQSIDRIDVNGYYEPSNCRIVKWVVQARNRRTTKRYLYMGEFLDLKTISERSGINYHTLWQRINKYGYTFNDALF